MATTGKPFPGVAKINGRYFWAVLASDPYAPDSMIAEGFADTREAAVIAAAAALIAVDPSIAKLDSFETDDDGQPVTTAYVEARRSDAWPAKMQYDRAHKRERRFKPTHADGAAPIDYLYFEYQDIDGCFPPYWRSYRIVRKTKMFVFYDAPNAGSASIHRVDRAELDANGFVDSRWHRLYSQAGMEREIDAQTRNASPDGNVLQSATAGQVFGLGRSFTRSQVVAEFRRMALTAHPDHGGDNEAFRLLIEARDRALAVALPDPVDATTEG